MAVARAVLVLASPFGPFQAQGGVAAAERGEEVRDFVAGRGDQSVWWRTAQPLRDLARGLRFEAAT